MFELVIIIFSFLLALLIVLYIMSRKLYKEDSAAVKERYRRGIHRDINNAIGKKGE